MEAKKWYKSWTIWANVALIVIDAVNQMAGIMPIPPAVITSIGVVGNILLRFKTDSPVTLK